MTKLKTKVDFTGQTIFVGMDVHAKSWNISLYCNEQYVSSFNQPPTSFAIGRICPLADGLPLKDGLILWRASSGEKPVRECV